MGQGAQVAEHPVLRVLPDGAGVQDHQIRLPGVIGEGEAAHLQHPHQLLAVRHVHQVPDSVLQDLHIGIEGFSDEALPGLHALLKPHPCVASLINAPDPDPVLQKHPPEDLQDLLLHPVDAKGQGLHHQHIRKFVHHKARQPVRLSEDDPAGFRVHHVLPVFPGIPDPFFQESLIRSVFPPAGKKAHPDLGIHVDEAVAHEVVVKIVDLQDISVFKRSLDPLDLIVIDPHASGLQGPALSLGQVYLCIRYLYHTFPFRTIRTGHTGSEP